MGMDAELIAIGPFSQAVVEHLDYPKDFYEDTPDGATVITSLFACGSSDSSHGLAKAFRVDSWQFQEHCNLDGRGADLDELRVWFEPDDIVDFLALRTAGFKFYYRPNG